MKVIDDWEPRVLAENFFEEFIHYPMPAKAIIPYNYCVLMKLYPQLEPFLQYIC